MPKASPQTVRALHNKTRSSTRLAEEVFVATYLKTLDATAALEAAGAKYKNRQYLSIAAYKYLNRPTVQEAIRTKHRARLERLEISAERVLNEISYIAFADMGNYLTLNDDGTCNIDFSAIPDQGSRAIGEITEDRYMEGKGDDAREIKRIRFKLHDKMRALELLAKHLGLLNKLISLHGGGLAVVNDEQVQFYVPQNERDAVNGQKALPSGKTLAEQAIDEAEFEVVDDGATTKT